MAKKSKVNKITYRIIRVLDGQYNKLLFKTRDRSEAFSLFRGEIKANEQVIFPREHIAKMHNGKKRIMPCKYEIYLLKSMGPDSAGENYEVFDGNWKIVQKHPYNMEETFMMFGYHYRNERKDIVDIVELLLKDKAKLREISVVNNKIVIFNNDMFDMIICKCISDARRLNKALYTLLNKFKGTKFLFLGIATPETISEWFDFIQEETGWNRIKVKRSSTKA